MPVPSTTPRRNPWPDYFHRAAQEEIGIAIELNHMNDGFESDLSNGRPPGFEGYTVCTCAIPNTIFIVKPGVRLD